MDTNLRIVALDLSLAATGIAVTHDHHGRAGVGCRTVHTARTRHGATDMDHQRVTKVLNDIAAACGWVDGQFTEGVKPHLVVIEWQPAYAGKGDVSLRIAELHGVVKFWLFSRGLAYVDVKPTHLKMWATGSGTTNESDERASKKSVREAVTATYGRLCTVATDDEADAVSLLSMACAAYGQPLVSGLRSRQTRALSAVQWPDLSTETGPVVPVVGASVSGGAGGDARRPARTGAAR